MSGGTQLKPKSNNNADLPLVRLKDAPAENAPLIGNKAASLAAIARHGVPVPDGLCITTPALLAAVEEIGHPAGEPGGAEFDQHLLDVPLPAALSAGLRKELQSLRQLVAGPASYSVRSSSTIEDSRDRSFAGQFYTALGVSEIERVEIEVRKCWASLFDADVIGLSGSGRPNLAGGAGMAVLIQSMVPADRSGVAFTRDPLSGDENLVIEASWGLGPPLVGGEITPDLIRASRSGQVLDYAVGSKRHSLFLERGTLRSHDQALGPAATRCLDPSDVARLARLAAQIERVLGSPQDIEFAFHGELLWILQARPITTIKPRPGHDLGNW